MDFILAIRLRSHLRLCTRGTRALSEMRELMGWLALPSSQKYNHWVEMILLTRSERQVELEDFKSSDSTSMLGLKEVRGKMSTARNEGHTEGAGGLVKQHRTGTIIRSTLMDMLSWGIWGSIEMSGIQ